PNRGGLAVEVRAIGGLPGADQVAVADAERARERAENRLIRGGSGLGLGLRGAPGESEDSGHGDEQGLLEHGASFDGATPLVRGRSTSDWVGKEGGGPDLPSAALM